ncbi:MAG TPA: hypothetical protein VF329_05080 [Gammaproteobacteria bacterium]
MARRKIASFPRRVYRVSRLEAAVIDDVARRAWKRSKNHDERLQRLFKLIRVDAQERGLSKERVQYIVQAFFAATA